MTGLTGSQAAAKALIAENVNTVFTLVDGSILPILDELIETNNKELILELNMDTINELQEKLDKLRELHKSVESESENPEETHPEIEE